MILQKKEFKDHLDDTDQYQSLIAEESYYIAEKRAYTPGSANRQKTRLKQKKIA